jgi:hypothetical protein
LSFNQAKKFNPGAGSPLAGAECGKPKTRSPSSNLSFAKIRLTVPSAANIMGGRKWAFSFSSCWPALASAGF